MVSFRKTAAIQIGLLGMLAVACAPNTGTEPQTATSGIDGESDQTVAAPAAAPMAEDTAEQPPSSQLVYSWDTEFSTFLSPPIEVRRLARDDCKANGYEIATVGTLALDGNIATATFICRGDFE